MKITVLGSCSGTEPMPGCHQTSVAVETGGRLYFIDAGENAGYASYLGGIPQQDTAALANPSLLLRLGNAIVTSLLALVFMVCTPPLIVSSPAG